MSKELMTNLFRQFGQTIGLPELTPDNDGYCCLSFDELVVHFQADAQEDDTLLMFSRLGEIDDEEPSALYRDLLAANLFWGGTAGATLGVEPDTKMVVLATKLSLRTLDNVHFEELLKNFIDVAEQWQKKIAQFTSTDETAEILDDHKQITALAEAQMHIIRG